MDMGVYSSIISKSGVGVLKTGSLVCPTRMGGPS
jgi:hypothetical protein